MTTQGFLFLLVVAIVGITIGAHFAEKWTPPGFQRTVSVAVIAAAVIFPAARFAGWCGWIRGGLHLSGRSRRNEDAAADIDAGDTADSRDQGRTGGDKRS